MPAPSNFSLSPSFDPASVPVEKLHQLIGAHVIDRNCVRFCVWSPTHDRVWLDCVDDGRRVAMDRVDGGYHVIEIKGMSAGSLYRYVFGPNASDNARPDPASRYQPQGVHGPSMVVATDFAWSDVRWNGIPRSDLVIYELHLGAFTEQGTFLSAIERLDEVVELGVTAIELMPLANAAGRWNWGYDGVNLFAPSQNFGSPEDLRRLIDACHAKGLAVFLDVVYNHLGPEGNYLGECGPYLSPHHTTVWGSAPNFDHPHDGAQLRRFFIANAIHWLDEYHFDGLRLDAIHCMRDESEPHVAAELSRAVHRWTSASGRSAVLIAESNVYDPNMLAPVSIGGIGFDAEWCDDFLHSVFAVARPGEQLSHRHYIAGVDLDQTLRFGYVYEGTLRTERRRHRPDKRVDTSGLVYSIQHHDSIGNHPLGKRLHQVASQEFQQAAAALLLLSPAIPMLFMGEEFACRHPFQFFVDFGDEALRQSVVEGRRREYPQHDWSGGTLPIDARAFFESKIGLARDGSPIMRSWYRQLLQLRRTWRDRGLLYDANLSVATDPSPGCYCLQYQADEASLLVAVRLNALDSLGNERRSTRASHGLFAEPIALPVIGELVLDSRQGESSAVGELLRNHAKVFVRDPVEARCRSGSSE